MSLALALGRLVMRIRPAPLAVAAKRVLRLRRQILATSQGTFWIDPASYAGQELATHGIYEPATVAVLRRLLKPGDTFVDIGANEGYFCVLAAKLVGPTGRVIAVEPQARLQEVLRRNFELNGCPQVDIVPAAVSDREGTTELHLTPDVNNSASGLFASTRYRLPTQSTPMLTLAQLVARLDASVRPVLKIDIESWEHEAILGSLELFRTGRIAALILELHPPLLARRGLDPEAVPHFLRQCGYDHLAGSNGLAWMRPTGWRAP